MLPTFNISIFQHAKANVPFTSAKPLLILESIRSIHYKALVEQIRAADLDTARELKKNLEAVTWAGEFKKRSKKPDDLLLYSGIICQDIDKMQPETLQSLRDSLKFNPLVFAYFVSPSGNGLKVLFIAANADPAKHEARYTALGEYLNKSYGIEYDTTGKDISRICFLSYDPELYLNEDAEMISDAQFQDWKPAEPIKKTAPKNTPKKDQYLATNYFEKCHVIVQKTITAGPGTNNKYAGQYSQQANRYGISEAECLAELENYLPDYDKAELKKTVAWHYNEGKAEHGKYLQNKRTTARAEGTPGTIYTEFDTTEKFWYLVGKLDKETGEIMCNPTTGEPLGEYRYSYDSGINFLQNNGFFKLKGEQNSYQFIRIDQLKKVMDFVGERNMKEFMLDYLKSAETPEFRRVREMFRRGAKNFCGTAILEGLDYQNPEIAKDSREMGFMYFRNCFLEISAAAITPKKYQHREQYIWEKQVKCHELIYTPGADCDFSRFLRYAVTGEKKDFDQYTDAQNILYRAACSTLGYLLHRYKDPTLTKAVVTTDKALRHGSENEGRSGKSLFGKALDYMLITTAIDGRNFSFDKDFAFQKVNIDTELINFNDIKPKFDFTRLFGMITEEFTIEKKGKDIITIPFADAPKFYISSNSTLKGEGSSTRARQQIIEFSAYFNEKWTPVHEFGRRFFSGWDETEWSAFYSFMAECMQLFLAEGLLDFPLENYAINALYEAPGFGERFVDYMEDTVLSQLKYNPEFDSGQLYEKYKQGTTDKIDWLKKNTFTKRVKEWAKIKDLEINAHRLDGRDKRGSIDWYTFTAIGTDIANDGIEGEETDLPF